MRIIILTSIIVLTSGFLNMQGDCRHNPDKNDKWQELVTNNGFINDSTASHINKDYVAGNTSTEEDDDKKSQTVYRYKAASNLHISLVENAYDNACFAERDFKRAIKYFQSEQPKYDKNNGCFAGLLQDNIYYEVKLKGKNDTLVKKFFQTFLKARLQHEAEPGTTFIKFYNKKATVK